MSLPSVLLHDHLDGGLRPRTALVLAEAGGYQDLPADNDLDLAAWFYQKDSGTLERYLQAFDHTISVIQDVGALERVAYEAAVDLAGDGVVYAEIRFSPLLHLEQGMGPAEVIEAVASRMRLDEEETGLKWGLIIDALRHIHDSERLVLLALEHRHLGVVGFDIATNRLQPDLHPVGLLYRAGLKVTLSTDNRLMSSTSMSEEFDFVRNYQGFEIDDLARVTWRSLDAAFCPWELKAALWEDVIAPASAAAGAKPEPVWA
jgi:adenosine deaminase